ncbi:DUF3918 family protein [Bacillus pumilus]
MPSKRDMKKLRKRVMRMM